MPPPNGGSIGEKRTLTGVTARDPKWRRPDGRRTCSRSRGR